MIKLKRHIIPELFLILFTSNYSQNYFTITDACLMINIPLLWYRRSLKHNRWLRWSMQYRSCNCQRITLHERCLLSTPDHPYLVAIMQNMNRLPWCTETSISYTHIIATYMHNLLLSCIIILLYFPDQLCFCSSTGDRRRVN